MHYPQDGDDVRIIVSKGAQKTIGAATEKVRAMKAWTAVLNHETNVDNDGIEEFEEFQ